MSRFLPALFFACALCVPEPAAAQEKPAPAQKKASPASDSSAAKKSATPKPQRSASRRTTKDGKPIATPAPLDNRNFLQRVFRFRPSGMPERYVAKKSKDPKAVEKEKPKADSKPKAKRTTKRRTDPTDAKPGDSTPPAPKVKTSDAPDSNPPPPKAKDKPKTDEMPPKPSPTAKPDDSGTPPPAVDELDRYSAAKGKALEDPTVKDLKTKADTTFGEEEGQKALRAYNKALFNKMRKIDPSLKERIDGTEAAVMRRLGE